VLQGAFDEYDMGLCQGCADYFRIKPCSSFIVVDGFLSAQQVYQAQKV
jgi:hypothetical protein